MMLAMARLRSLCMLLRTGTLAGGSGSSVPGAVIIMVSTRSPGGAPLRSSISCSIPMGTGSQCCCRWCDVVFPLCTVNCTWCGNLLSNSSSKFRARGVVGEGSTRGVWSGRPRVQSRLFWIPWMALKKHHTSLVACGKSNWAYGCLTKASSALKASCAYCKIKSSQHQRINLRMKRVWSSVPDLISSDLEIQLLRGGKKSQKRLEWDNLTSLAFRCPLRSLFLFWFFFTFAVALYSHTCQTPGQVWLCLFRAGPRLSVDEVTTVGTDSGMLLPPFSIRSSSHTDSVLASPVPGSQLKPVVDRWSSEVSDISTFSLRG